MVTSCSKKLTQKLLSFWHMFMFNCLSHLKFSGWLMVIQFTLTTIAWSHYVGWSDEQIKSLRLGGKKNLEVKVESCLFSSLLQYIRNTAWYFRTKEISVGGQVFRSARDPIRWDPAQSITTGCKTVFVQFNSSSFLTSLIEEHYILCGSVLHSVCMMLQDVLSCDPFQCFSSPSWSSYTGLSQKIRILW